METIASQILAGQRITDEDFQILASEADLHLLGFLANAIRKRLHPDKKVTYVIDRNINYTDICISACKFCAFYKHPKDEKGSVLTFKELEDKIEETLQLGGTQILLQGGLHPDLPFEFYEDMVRFIKSRKIHLHGFSPPEIFHFSQLAKIPIDEVLDRLIAAGLDSIPGGGAEILSDRVRQVTAPQKCGAAQWLEVMQKAHEKGLKTTATMMFGHIETAAERLGHLRRLRELQDKTAGFTAFIPWPFQPGNTELKNDTLSAKTGGFEYLKTLALSRIYLDNFPNIQASWVTQGPKIAQTALFFGANDFGSTMIEENVVAAAGVSFTLSESEIRRLVADAGFIPQQRLMDYTPAG